MAAARPRHPRRVGEGGGGAPIAAGQGACADAQRMGPVTYRSTAVEAGCEGTGRPELARESGQAPPPGGRMVGWRKMGRHQNSP